MNKGKNIVSSRLSFRGNSVIYHFLAKVQSSTCTTCRKYLWYLKWPCYLQNQVLFINWVLFTSKVLKLVDAYNKSMVADHFYYQIWFKVGTLVFHHNWSNISINSIYLPYVWWNNQYHFTIIYYITLKRNKNIVK